MRFLKILLGIVIVSVLMITANNYWIIHNTKNQMYSQTDLIPKNKVGLLLGTSKYVSKGNINLYYTYRINAAVTLFNAGKIEYILISGDNGSPYYDEPTTFKNDLIKRGVPEEKIILDFAGFRTLDSVIRAKEIFGQTSFTVISQQFHNERAIFLANRLQIDAVAFNAQSVNASYGYKVIAREYLARAKASLDLIFNVKPKYLGEKVKIA